jgi:hypothetical protein
VCQTLASLIAVDKNIENPSKIARISSNLCCFVWFLGKFTVLPTYDVQTLHDLCAKAGEDMIRTARAERVGEAYSSYVREVYEDSGIVENEENVSLFNGGFEVTHIGTRFCLLGDYDESGNVVACKESEVTLLFFLGLDHRAFQKIAPAKVRLPFPLTKQLKVGDQLHLEIRRMKNSAIWVPTECL